MNQEKKLSSLTATGADRLPTEEILARLRAIHIATEWDGELRRHFDCLLQRKANGELSPRPTLFAASRETRGVLVTHAPGGCKTSLVGHMLRTHPALSGSQAWIEVTVPSPPSLRSLIQALLIKSGYPIVKEAAEASVLTEQIKRRFANLQTGVLWIDEAQDLVAVGKGNMLRTIKSFMQGSAPVVMILSGTPALLKLIQSDEQLNRRFSKLVLPLLDPFGDADKIQSVLQSYSEAAGMQLATGDDLPQRLIHASRLLFGRCIENIIGAIEMALRDGETELNDFHFADYYAMQEGCPPQANVFEVEHWQEVIVGHLEDG